MGGGNKRMHAMITQHILAPWAAALPPKCTGTVQVQERTEEHI
jgi:hypothetical protein